MTPLALLPVLIRLLVPAGQTPPGLDLATATAETERVWAGQIRLEVADGGEVLPGGAITLWIRFADRLGPAAHAEALAWTPFTDGRPGGVITISPARIRAALARGGRHTARGHRHDAGTAESDQLARATGRVLAHELGHVLLGEPGHTRGGLMRPGFSAAELTDASHAPFTLPPAAFAAAPFTALEARRQPATPDGRQ